MYGRQTDDGDGAERSLRGVCGVVRVERERLQRGGLRVVRFPRMEPPLALSPYSSRSYTGATRELRAAPDGLTPGELTRLTGICYESLHHALNRLERRGVLLCEDDQRRISIFTE